jgi:hypothetical protein
MRVLFNLYIMMCYCCVAGILIKLLRITPKNILFWVIGISFGIIVFILDNYIILKICKEK